MLITGEAKEEIKWWLCNAATSLAPISRPPVDFTSLSDASLKEWGAVCRDKKTGGAWNATEKRKHII